MTRWSLGVALLGAGTMASGGPAVPRRHLVEIRGMAFNPERLEVVRGDTVIWVNQDIVPHTATARPAWDTGTLDRGDRGLVVPKQAGELRYVCTLHPTMKGTLVAR